MTADDRALNEAAAAQRLGVSVSTLRNWRRLNRGPTFRKFGRAVRYLPSDIDEYVSATSSAEKSQDPRRRSQ